MSTPSTGEFLVHLRGLGVQVSADAGKLRYAAPKGVLTPDLRNELASRKDKLLAFLSEADQVSPAHANPILRVARQGELPLSFAQMRLWLLDRFEPDNAAYNIPSTFRLKGGLNLAVLQRSLSEIVRRHEALRTCFPTIQGQPVQKIGAPETMEIPVIDLCDLSEAAGQEQAARLSAIDAKRPFDLSKGPLMRASVIRLADQEHLLLLNVHHIVFDGWSLGVFLRELSLLYNAFLRGEASPLPELPIQYVDFAFWQRQYLRGDVLQAQLGYWRENLKGKLPVLELPADHPRPALQTYDGSIFSFTVPRDLTDALKDLSRREGVTPYVTLLATFQALLHRYTGHDDILVGTPIANRNRAEIEPLIGFFVNMLAMRGDLSGGPSFRELLGRLRKIAMDAYDHQDMPFERLVEELNPERDLSRNPIFQVVLSLQNMPVEPLELSGIEASRVSSKGATAKFDLSLYAAERPDGLYCAFEYNTKLYNADRIERMAGHLRVLLENVVRDPGQRVSELPILTGDERRQLLLAWNDTQTAYPVDKCVHELFEIQAQKTPAAVAVEFGSERLSFSELDERSTQFAQHLRSLGAGPGFLVAVYIERSLELAVALLGILKAGAAYLPIDLTFPEERIAFMLADAQPSVLATVKRLLPKVPLCHSEIACVDSFKTDENPRAAHALEPGDLAYVIYTSGSTGKPKGVEICHRAVVNFLNSMRQAPGIEAQDTLLSVTTPSFDIFGLEFWLPLATGAKVVIAPAEAARDGKALAAEMERCGATIMQATPSTWRLLLDSGWAGNSSLKVLCGGEAWDRQLAEHLLPRCASLWNMYGPTESTIWSAVSRVERGQPVLIGLPIANTKFYVADVNLQLAPIGVPGELFIGGDGLARGYLNRPELTAEKFIPDPFSGEPGGRLYKTGDLCRRLADGAVEYLGRLDHQIKIRGFRIELGEIETALLKDPGIAECAVSVREDQPGDKRLVAYIVPATAGGTASPDGLRDGLRKELPAYMIPSAFVTLARLPLTANGKIDRKALPVPEPSREHVAERAVVGPRNLMELQLHDVWSRVLRLPEIGLRDNFFDLGGHSLRAVQLVNEIYKSLDRHVPLAMFVQNPTIEALAKVLQSEDHANRQPRLIPLRPRRSAGALFFIGATLAECRLAQHLGVDLAVFATAVPLPEEMVRLAARGEDVEGPSVEELAEAHANLICTRDPSGPCFLVGYSFHGTVAFEVARQLMARGRDVEAVLLLDSWVMAPTLWQKLRRLSPGRAVKSVKFRTSRWLSYEKSAALSCWEQGGKLLWEVPWEILGKIYRNARRKYRPRPLETRGILFRARHSEKAHYYRILGDLGWRSFFAGGFEIVEIAGAHLSLLSESNLPELSQRFNEHIDRGSKEAGEFRQEIEPVNEASTVG